MAAESVDRDVKSVEEAQQFAFNDTIACINTIHALSPAHRESIADDYRSIGAAIHLFKSQSNNSWTAPVVEVITNYACTRGGGATYKVMCMLDVDIPDAEKEQTEPQADLKKKQTEPQMGKKKNRTGPQADRKKKQTEPHVGWEAEFNGTREGNGYLRLDRNLLKLGRPPKGQTVETYGFEMGRPLTDLGNHGTVERTCSFRRYR